MNLAAPTGLLAFRLFLHAILGATSQASPTTSLAVPATEHSSVALGLRTKLRFVNACPRPWRVVRPSKSFAFRRLCRPSLTHPWRDFSGFANHQPCRSGHRAQLGGARPAHEAALRKRLSSPLASRSALEKLCFSSALPIEPHPSMARLLRLCQTPALPFRPPSTARWRSACARSCAS